MVNLKKKERMPNQRFGTYDIRVNSTQRALIYRALKEHHQTNMDQAVYNESSTVHLAELMDTFDPKQFHLESGGVLNDLTK